MALTRPMRSPSQPNNTPPVAAPTRKSAVMTPTQRAISGLLGSEMSSKSRRAGLATSGTKPISSPSNSQPSRAAVRAIHLPKFEPEFMMGFQNVKVGGDDGRITGNGHAANHFQRIGLGSPED